jgi:hypothetical protein
MLVKTIYDYSDVLDFDDDEILNTGIIIGQVETLLEHAIEMAKLVERDKLEGHEIYMTAVSLIEESLSIPDYECICMTYLLLGCPE